MRSVQRNRAVLLWILAVLLATASIVLPRLLKLNEHFASGGFTPAAYGIVATIFISGIIMGAFDPARAARWAVVLGLAPLAETALRMIQQGPGNLWPIAIFLALVLGLAPAALGTVVGKNLRRMVTVAEM